MSSDEGEKFYMDYWQFEGELEQSQLLNTGISLRARDEEEEARLLANSSATMSFRPPFALHTEEWSDTLGFEDLRARSVVDDRSSAAVLAMLTKRGFQCPTGTANCTDVGFPNSCCPTTETCYPIQELVKVIFLQNCCISLTYESGELVSCFETSLGSLALMSAKHLQSSQLPRTSLDFAVLISWIVRAKGQLAVVPMGWCVDQVSLFPRAFYHTLCPASYLFSSFASRCDCPIATISTPNSAH
jgi:hypothetical protein